MKVGAWKYKYTWFARNGGTLQACPWSCLSLYLLGFILIDSLFSQFDTIRQDSLIRVPSHPCSLRGSVCWFVSFFRISSWSHQEGVCKVYTSRRRSWLRWVDFEQPYDLKQFSCSKRSVAVGKQTFYSTFVASLRCASTFVLADCQKTWKLQCSHGTKWIFFCFRKLTYNLDNAVSNGIIASLS